MCMTSAEALKHGSVNSSKLTVSLTSNDSVGLHVVHPVTSFVCAAFIGNRMTKSNWLAS